MTNSTQTNNYTKHLVKKVFCLLLLVINKYNKWQCTLQLYIIIYYSQACYLLLEASAIIWRYVGHNFIIFSIIWFDSLHDVMSDENAQMVTGCQFLLRLRQVSHLMFSRLFYFYFFLIYLVIFCLDTAHGPLTDWVSPPTSVLSWVGDSAGHVKKLDGQQTNTHTGDDIYSEGHRQKSCRYFT